MNQVNVIGRVGADIEIRYTTSGKAVGELNLAVDDGYGENKKTVWLGVTLWGQTAELAQKAVRKGDRLGITGRLSQEEWEDKATGKKQRKTKVTASEMHLLEKKRDDNQSSPPTQRSQSAPAPASSSAADDDFETIPF